MKSAHNVVSQRENKSHQHKYANTWASKRWARNTSSWTVSFSASALHPEQNDFLRLHWQQIRIRITGRENIFSFFFSKISYFSKQIALRTYSAFGRRLEGKRVTISQGKWLTFVNGVPFFKKKFCPGNLTAFQELRFQS